ncbi:MAG TPA: GNAT family N-acetyltransferase [Caulobacteraceae bacterium]|jgi:GNAT superfamily N-acetyltransferase|nr:GNAT family N-acetyltransferase [Caulobacteraceae bacterium]
MDPRELALRPAVAAEQMELEALQWRASLALPEYRDALMANIDAIELPLAQIEAGWVRVADHRGAAVGFSVVLPRADGAMELDGLFVEPSCWRMGVGRMLVGQAARSVRGLGQSALHVVANPLALGFYKACGFALIDRCDTQFGIGLVMRLTVDG